MTAKPMKDFAPGEIMFTSENLGDDKNRMEVREVFYIREPDRVCCYPYNVAVARIGIAQGAPEDDDEIYPRYVRFPNKPCRDPGEADGRTLAHLLSESTSVWAHFFQEHLARQSE